MSLFSKKKETDLGDEDLLAELEKETAKLGDPRVPNVSPTGGLKPPAPASKPPAAPPRPLARPTTPSLETSQVAKLPLFMKVEQYDKIVGELNTLVETLLSMEQTLQHMETLEKEEDEATKRWGEQLNTTKEQVRLLLGEMPETGKLRELVGKKKKTAQTKKLQKDVEKLKKDLVLKKNDAPKVAPLPPNPLHNEVTGLRDSIKSLHDEMNHLHMEFKMLNSLTQLKQKTAVKNIQQQTKPPEPQYKKAAEKRPWG